MIMNIETIEGLNIEQGLRNTGNSVSIYTRLLTHFFTSCSDYHQQLQLAVQGNQPEQIKKIIHKLYGVSELLGFEIIAQDCFFLLSNPVGNTENQALIKSRLNNLLLYLERVYMQNQDKIQIGSKR